MRKMRSVLGAQATYYFLTGVWALVHRRSFEAMTRAKVDYWLVDMVGLMTICNAATIALGTFRRCPSREIVTLSTMTAAAFMAIDTIFVARRRIRGIYLLDSAIEGTFIAGLSLSGLHRSDQDK